VRQRPHLRSHVRTPAGQQQRMQSDSGT
jgi:hypothetical protein